MKSSMKKEFMKYVSQNILGMIGLSLYILADTFFISVAVGSNGITALNLVLPVYSLIFAIGAMIGVGSAIRFSIRKNQKSPEGKAYFMNALFWGTIIGAVFMLLGGLFSGRIVELLGGDAEIVAVGKSYTKIFMLFAPCFIWNHICNAFVRNDGNPSIAMAATLFSSLFNILFDYVLMFPLGMGMNGAALATALSPVIGVAICGIHFCSKKNTISFHPVKPSIHMLFESCQVGVAAFVGEISSGVITMVFNMLILRIAGNVGVAAYGVVANSALVATSVFNGIAQGSQPLVSEAYGRGDKKSVLLLRNMGIGTALVLAVFIYMAVYFGAEEIAAVFNSEQDLFLADYAAMGLRIYFVGFLFAGINIVGSSVFSAAAAANWAFVVSIMRGVVAIIACAFLFSAVLGMNGVWAAFPAGELLTLGVTVLGMKRIAK